MGLYRSLRRTHTIHYTDKSGKGKHEAKVETFLAPEAAALCGHQCANNDVPGCLTSDPNVRLHSCEAGTECQVIQSTNVVWITPIIARSSDGTDIPEVGAGGGGGDLTKTHELDLTDADVVMELIDLCSRSTNDPATRQKIKEMIKASTHAPSRTMLFADLGIPSLDHDISLDEFAKLLIRATKRDGDDEEVTKGSATSKITTFEQKLPRTIVSTLRDEDHHN